MEIIRTKLLTELQAAQIRQLWNDEYPVRLKNRFGMLLEGVKNDEHYLIEDEHKKVQAWAVSFEKENETRFSILVSEKHQGQQLGSRLIKALQQNHHTFFGWVIDHDRDVKNDGTPYRTPLPFYLKHGFSICPDRMKTDIIDAVKVKWSGGL